MAIFPLSNFCLKSVALDLTIYPGAEIYSELMSYADSKILAELKANSEYWKKYETPVAAVATTVNDTYLKSQGQTDGKKSYGRFVDLMISYEKMQASE